jgi:hypothetical protein
MMKTTVQKAPYYIDVAVRAVRIPRSWLTYIVVALLASSSAAAQAPSRFSFVADGGFAKADTLQGFSLSIGGARTWKFGFASAALDFVIGPPVYSDRYYTDTFSNGQSRCRDSTNGQFASTSLCSGEPTTDVGALLDAGLRFHESFPLEIGAGVRLGALTVPVVTVGFSRPFATFTGRWYLRGIAGDGYAGGRIGVRVGSR